MEQDDVDRHGMFGKFQLPAMGKRTLTTQTQVHNSKRHRTSQACPSAGDVLILCRLFSFDTVLKGRMDIVVVVVVQLPTYSREPERSVIPTTRSCVCACVRVRGEAGSGEKPKVKHVQREGGLRGEEEDEVHTQTQTNVT